MGSSMLDGFFTSFEKGQDSGEQDDDDGEGGEADAMQEYCGLLKNLQFSDDDAHRLFELVDIDGNGRVSRKEFTRGIRLFAPACVLEDLRLHCAMRFHGV